MTLLQPHTYGSKGMSRLPLPAAYVDPAFVACLREAISTTELLEQFDRLYGARLLRKPSRDNMRAFTEFVHSSLYLTLPDEAIEALRVVAIEPPLTDAQVAAQDSMFGVLPEMKR